MYSFCYHWYDSFNKFGKTDMVKKINQWFTTIHVKWTGKIQQQGKKMGENQFQVLPKAQH